MKYVKGDALDFEVDIDLDLTDYKIRASVFDNKDVEIKKATANSGGADSQILVTTFGATSYFTVFVDSGPTIIWYLSKDIQL